MRAESIAPVLDLAERVGHVPLPPYIRRPDAVQDRERYQTIYARQPGAIAAPTAGLHFSHEIIEELSKKGIAIAYVTLHVGAGTFQPIRVDNVLEHQMHAEWVSVPQKTCDAIKATRNNGGRIIAVGTTSVRALESAAQATGYPVTFQNETKLFIYPGYKFRTVDALITNFHLPESSLLMLVCAFSGYEQVMNAYHHAVSCGYRFFSYGDAMFLTKKSTN